MSDKKKISLKLSKNDNSLGYVYLPDHLGHGVYGAVDDTFPLDEFIGEYEGPSIYLDFKNNKLVGIEIVP